MDSPYEIRNHEGECLIQRKLHRLLLLLLFSVVSLPAYSQAPRTIDLSVISPLTLREGSVITVGVSLSTAPTGTVTVTISENEDDATLDKTTLTFTPSLNYQTVNITAGWDEDQENENFTISFAASGADFHGISRDLDVVIHDNINTYNIRVFDSTFSVGEASTFPQTVQLSQAPTTNVTVTLTVADPTAVTVSPTSLTFTPTNYSTPQPVIISGVDDAIFNSPRVRTTIELTATGAIEYTGVTNTIRVSVYDNEPFTADILEGTSNNRYIYVRPYGGQGDVTVTLTSSNPNVVTVLPTTLTYPEDEGGQSKAYTITAVDNDALGNATALITITPSANYLPPGATVPLPIRGVNVQVEDDDIQSAEIRVTPSSVEVSEGSSKTYTAVLTVAPISTVTVAVTGHAGTDLSPDLTSLEFTTTNWNQPQTVTITADDDPDGQDDVITLKHTASGGGYDGKTSNVVVTVNDQDDVALVVSPVNLSITEGGSGTYTLRLSTQPTADVTVAVSSPSSKVAMDTNSDSPGNQSTMEFTASTWNQPQAVSVATSHDDDAINDTIVLSNTASGGDYDAITADVTVTITDPDAAQLVVSPTDITIPEGGTGTYTVRLSTEPTADVTVNVLVDSGEMTMDTQSSSPGSQSSMEFTTATWNEPQTVTIAAGNDDDAINGIGVLRNTANGGDYTGKTALVNVTITDVDDTELVIAPTNLTLVEGASGAYTVRLSSEPTADVTVIVSGPLNDATFDTNENLRGNQSTMEFTTSNWYELQTVTVNTLEDDDGIHESLTLQNTASGGNYAGVAGDVQVTIRDQDDIRLIVTPTDLTISEGGSGFYTVRLSSEPSGDVTVYVINTSEILTIDTNSDAPGIQTNLEFNTSNWSQPQTVRINTEEDDDVENHLVILGNTASGANYTGITADVEVTVIDDDDIGLVVTPTDISITEGSRGVYTVHLSSQPSADVTVTVSNLSNDITFDTNSSQLDSQSIMEFTTSTWSLPQTVIVTTEHDDDAIDGSAILRNRASGGNYEGQTADVNVTITDIHDVALVINPTHLTITEGESGNFTVHLSSEPTASVSVSISVMLGEVMIDTNMDVMGNQSILKFTTLTWNQPQTVSVTTFEDDDIANESATLLLTASGGNYTDETGKVMVTITDDDDPREVTLTAAPNPVDEGQSIIVTVLLSQRLLNPVTIPLSVTAVSAEKDDFTPVTSVTIEESSLSGTASIHTVEDTDLDDETINVALGAMPDWLTLGDPSAAEITIVDNSPPPNRAPTVTIQCQPCTMPMNATSQLTALASDPDGDPLIYSWSASVGSFEGDTDQATVRWKAPNVPGQASIEVNVSDDRGGTASDAMNMYIINQPPYFDQSPYHFELLEKLDGRLNAIELGMVTAVDADGDGLVYKLIRGDQDRFSVDMHSGKVLYQGPGEDYETNLQDFEMDVHAEDEFGADDSVKVIIKVIDVNEHPEAINDEAITIEDQSIQINVLANDMDPDGDPLRVHSTTTATHGTVQIVSREHVLYTPNNDFHGTDIFTYIASDGRGLTDTASVILSVIPVNDAPKAVGTIPDQFLDEGGQTIHIDLSPYFVDVDSDNLSYETQSGDPSIVNSIITGSTMELIPLNYGSTRVIVIASDPQGLQATHSFQVHVSDRLQRAVIENLLAATARGHLTSIRTALSHRLDMDLCQPSNLAVMGRHLPLSWKRAMTTLSTQVRSTYPSALRAIEHRYGRYGSYYAYARPVNRFPAAMKFEEFLSPLLPIPSLAQHHSELSSEIANFFLSWDGVTDEHQACSTRGRWTFWGQGDLQRFAGSPSVFGYASEYSDERLTALIGIDIRLEKRWLTGISLSRSHSVGNWSVVNSSGKLTQHMTTVAPYLQWKSPSTSIWGSIGVGRGHMRNVRATGRMGTSDTSLEVGMLQLQRRISSPRGIDVSVIGDVSYARIYTTEGLETIDDQNVSVNQMRVGMNLSLPLHLGRATIKPSGSAYARRDGGAGQTGRGVEINGGLLAIYKMVRLHAKARILAHHTAQGYSERGAAITLTLGKHQNQQGFSLLINPVWGTPSSTTRSFLDAPIRSAFLYQNNLPDRWSISALANYGIQLPRGFRLDLHSNFGPSIGGVGLGFRLSTSHEIPHPVTTIDSQKYLVP